MLVVVDVAQIERLGLALDADQPDFVEKIVLFAEHIVMPDQFEYRQEGHGG